MFILSKHLSSIVLLCCFLMTWNVSQSAWGQTIHVILAADRADVGLKPAMETDLNNMTNIFRSHIPPAHLNLITIAAESMTADAILQSVDDLQNVAPNDTIVFYYSGHGAYDDASKKQYLEMAGRGNLYRDTLLAKIQGKFPRLSVFLTDCCNNKNPNIVSARAAGGVADEQIRTPESFSPLFENLFVFPKGTADITSSTIGEYSFAISAARGSVFTCAFAEVAETNKTNGDEMNWEKFAEKLGSKTQDIFLKEIPRSGRAGQIKQTPRAYSLPGKYIAADLLGEKPQNETAGPRLGLRASNYSGEGVQITEVAPDSPAAKAGFFYGEIITEINGTTIKNETDYSQAVDQSPKTMIMKLKKQDGTSRTLNVELGW